MSKKLLLACAIHAVFLLSAASAHYLWVTVDRQSGENGTANIYFEESPSPGDGHYLDPFVKAGKTWLRTLAQIEPRELPTSELTRSEHRWLSASLPDDAPRSIDSYGKFGVYRYGKTDVLLHYYARLLDVTTHGQLHELARAEHMKLDIVPHDEGDEVALTVLWKGEPAAARTVHIRGPKGFRKNAATDDRGVVRFTPAAEGRYTFRTSVEQNTPGREGDQDYALVRHNATMLMRLPLDR